MKKYVLVGALALAVLALSQGTASAWCYQVYCPCWEFPIPRFPIVLPSVKFRCADCVPCAPHYAQPWYLYYPPQAQSGYSSPWFNYAAPLAYPYAGAPQGYGNYAAAPQQGYAPQATTRNYARQGYFAGQNYGAQGSFATPSYWYGR
jgi:hypothetical protein